jgi:hypothetical protein
MWRLGLLKNQSANEAIGASFDVGFSKKGPRIGLEGTKRYWIVHRQALDLSAGLAQIRAGGTPAPGEDDRRLALTGAVQYSAYDLIAAVVRADVAPGRETVAAVYGGGQLRSSGAMFGTLLFGAAVAVVSSIVTSADF